MDTVSLCQLCWTAVLHFGVNSEILMNEMPQSMSSYCLYALWSIFFSAGEISWVLHEISFVKITTTKNSGVETLTSGKENLAPILCFNVECFTDRLWNIIIITIAIINEIQSFSLYIKNSTSTTRICGARRSQIVERQQKKQRPLQFQLKMHFQVKLQGSLSLLLVFFILNSVSRCCTLLVHCIWGENILFALTNPYCLCERFHCINVETNRKGLHRCEILWELGDARIASRLTC